MENNQHLVFVYGSLKNGYGNYEYHLSESEFVGEGFTLHAAYDMESLGGFPGVRKNGDCFIQGELYNVNDETFKNLDRLEGNGSLYLREETEVVTQDGEVHKAWMYFFLRPPWGDKKNYKHVAHFETTLDAFIQSWQRPVTLF